jgi:hypothetical protein
MDTAEIAYEELRKKHDKPKDDKDDNHCKWERRGHHDHDKKYKHIHELEHSIKCLADAMAHLGRGHHLHELLHVIKWPGWTTPAEFAFVNAILDNIASELRLLERLQADLVEASKKVADKRHKHDKCDKYD